MKLKTNRKTPSYQGYIVGFRAWRVDSIEITADGKSALENLRLISRYPKAGTHKGSTYIKATFEVETHKPSKCPVPLYGKSKAHVAPGASCTCGYYAYHSLDDLKKSLHSSENVFIGAVIGWGKVQLHAEGFRAQYMKPIAFMSNPHPPLTENGKLILKGLAENYAIPILNKKDILSFAEDFGVIYNHTPGYKAKNPHLRKFKPNPQGILKSSRRHPGRLLCFYIISYLLFQLGISLVTNTRTWPLLLMLPLLVATFSTLFIITWNLRYL